jgi:hypothetical protein
MKKKLKASGVGGKRVTIGKGLGNRRLSAGMVSESDRISIAARLEHFRASNSNGFLASSFNPSLYKTKKSWHSWSTLNFFYGCVVLRLFLPSSRFSISCAAITKRASSVDPILYRQYCLLPISLDLLMFQEDLIFLLSVHRTHHSYCSQIFSRNMGIRATGLMPLS